MKLSEIIKDIPLLGGGKAPALEIRDICYDSRRVRPGDLFVAVRGMASDGHDFIPQAVRQGAAAVLCERASVQDVPVLLTPDSRLALALASAAYFGHPADALTMVGVTGTNGKTTSTTLTKHILESALGAKTGLIGTIANYIGEEELPTERTTPESYELQKLLRRMVDAGCTHAVMEVSSHALALDRVASIRFQAGLFTNLTQDHLDFHRTMEAYAEAKARLFAQCDRAAIHVDDPWGAYMCDRAACPVLTFGVEAPTAGLRAEEVRYDASGVAFQAVYGAERVPVRLGIPGRFSVENALTALSAALLCDIPLAEAARALAACGGVKGRVEVVPGTGDYTIVIDYAHTPDALEKVLSTMRAVAPGRVVAVFGCGGDRDATKRPLMGGVAARMADFCVVTSDNPRTEEPEAIIRDILAGMPPETPRAVIADRREAIAWAMEHHESGDIIVLAGKGHETYQEVCGVKRHMDEREIVAEQLQRMEETRK